jgi:hypothetical protein
MDWANGILAVFALLALLGAGSQTAQAAPLDARHGRGEANPLQPPALASDPSPLPDLITLAPQDLVVIQIAGSNRRLVRFSNAVANTGLIDLELNGRYNPDGGGFNVSQRVPGHAGLFEFIPLETRLHYHPEHFHWHLDEFARYELWTAAPGGVLKNLVRTNGKISYCIMDTDPLPGTTGSPRHLSCGPFQQGLSIGWADTYERHLPGQWVDITGLPDGFYALRSIVDPGNYLHETDEDNNDALVTFYLHDGRISSLRSALADWSRLRPVP